MTLEEEFTAALRGTVEAARSRFRSLFTDEELAEAKLRLEDLGMDTSTIG